MPASLPCCSGPSGFRLPTSHSLASDISTHAGPLVPMDQGRGSTTASDTFRAAVTNYQKLGALKQQKFILS